MIYKRFIATLMVGLMIVQAPAVVFAADQNSASMPTPAATVSPSESPAADTTAPSMPGLALVDAVQTRVDLSWSASTDNVGVVGYSLYRNGILLDSLGASSNRYSDMYVAPASSYSYSLTSVDAAGNVSPASALSVTTPPTATPPPAAPAAPATGPQGTVSGSTPAPTPSATPAATGKIPDYAFNDTTGKWEPTLVSSFTWDSVAALYSSPFYRYDAKTGWYHVIPHVTPSEAINGLTADNANPAALLAAILGVGDPSNNNTGPNSTNNASSTTRNSLLAQLFGSASVTNGIGSNSITGDAAVAANTNAGSAKTGAAKVVVNLLNLLNSMWTWSSGGFGYFVHNIWGNQTGDINLTSADTGGGGGQVGSMSCPGELSGNTNTGPSSTNTASTACSNDITIQNRPSGSITNNVDVLAQSGNASVHSNTNAGNATSGDARAELNLVNLINSAIGAGQTFLGMFNIYGNLNGDILFPTLGLNGSVASSAANSSANNNVTGPNSTNTAANSVTNSADITNAPVATVDNNIRTGAMSGSATVSGNTSAGSATTGNADTNTSVFNLFDTSIFGDNAVLVIINDMGHWVGRLMNLGVNGGSGSGLLTSNALVSTNQNTGPNSSNTADNTVSNNLSITNAPTENITNNIRAGAVSGNADVTNNASAGNATTGNATVSTSVANILGSHLNFRKIFGILIINVFGSWVGDVGNNTAAGNAPTPGRGSGQPLRAVTQSTAHSTTRLTAGAGTLSSASTSGASNNSVSAATNVSSNNSSVLAAEHAVVKATTAAGAKSSNVLLGVSVIIMAIAAALGILERRMKRA